MKAAMATRNNNSNSNSKRPPLPKGRSGAVRITNLVQGDAEPTAQTTPATPAAEATPATPAAEATPAPAPAPAESGSTAAFDLSAWLETQTVKLDAIPEGSKGSKGSKGSNDPVRVHWAPEAVSVASAAGIRLPGLFPVKGDGLKASLAANGEHGWGSRWVGPVSRGRDGDTALQTLWESVGSRIANGQKVATVEVIAASVLIQKRCALKGKTPRSWVYNLTAQDADGGAYTCINHQLAKMAGGMVVIQAEFTFKV